MNVGMVWRGSSIRPSIFCQTAVTASWINLSFTDSIYLFRLLRDNGNGRWISNYIHFKVQDEVINPFPNLKGCIIEVLELIYDIIPDFTDCLITYQCWD